MSIRYLFVPALSVLIAGCAATHPSSPESDVRPGVATPPVRAEEARAILPASLPIAHAGVGAAVSVSSTQREEPGEGPAEALVDGDLSTRWSSAYEAPQQVSVTLSDARPLAAVRLHWEAASANYYTVAVTDDGETWVEAAVVITQDPGPRVDTLDLENRMVRGLRLDLLERVNPEWGFSLFEIELIAAE